MKNNKDILEKESNGEFSCVLFSYDILQMVRK